MSKIYVVALLLSIILNLLFISAWFYDDRSRGWNLSWSRKAAGEAEIAASISCSGHGRVYLDGLILDGSQEPVCECNACYGGPDCSKLDPSCFANADGGDPLFLEPFWVQHAASSAVVVAGWHRMSYSFDKGNAISPELEKNIRKLHSVVGNAVTEGRYIVFGAGSTQLLNAAVHAFSPHTNSSQSPARVVASIPFYPVYERQTDFFRSMNYKFEGDSSLWVNNSDTSRDVIEFVTSPNNPDGKLKKAVLQGPNVNVVYDYAYFWPHFTAIPAPADRDMMIFTLSKFTGHAGSRFGWALVKDEAIYQRMNTYLEYNTIGVSKDTQLRALKLIKVVLEDGGNAIFKFGHQTMKKRWERLSMTLSLSNRFSLQKIPPEYCTFFNKVRHASPAYAWVKCERKEDKDCYAVLKGGDITGRRGSKFYGGDRYVRLSLIRRQDDFDLLIHKLDRLLSMEDGSKSI